MSLVTSQSDLETRLSQAMVEARAEFGWTLVSASSYVGMQRGPEHTIMGSLLPLATNDDLQAWKAFLQGKGWGEEDIKKAGYSKAASAYVKLRRDGQYA